MTVKIISELWWLTYRNGEKNIKKNSIWFTSVFDEICRVSLRIEFVGLGNILNVLTSLEVVIQRTVCCLMNYT